MRTLRPFAPALTALCLTADVAPAQSITPAGSATARHDILPLDPGWPQLAGDARRTALTPRLTPLDLTTPRWTADSDDAARPILFNGPASPVTYAGRVYVPGFSAGQDRLFCFDAATGTPLWSAPLAPLALDSWSSPAIDGPNNTVLIASGTELAAIDATTGQRRWTRPIGRSLVNASPLVTTNRGPRDRVFLTDYSYDVAGNGRLLCINADPFDAALNPYSPGQIVWTAALPGETSGATPASDGTRVYVTCTDAAGKARVLAFDAGTTAPTPAPLWSFTHTGPGGAFGGVSVAHGRLYAATYAFTSGQLNSRLIALRAVDGSLLWTTPASRSASIPTPLPDGRVLLSTGIPPDPIFGDFGSRPSLQLFSPAGALLLDTALDSWTDLDADNIIDEGEYLRLAGWNTHVLAHAPHAGAPPRVLVGRIGLSGQALEPFEGLVEITLGAGPLSGMWSVVGLGTQGGSSPAVWRDNTGDVLLYSVGPGGLSAFAPLDPIGTGAAP